MTTGYCNVPDLRPDPATRKAVAHWAEYLENDEYDEGEADEIAVEEAAWRKAHPDAGPSVYDSGDMSPGTIRAIEDVTELMGQRDEFAEDAAARKSFSADSPEARAARVVKPLTGEEATPRDPNAPLRAGGCHVVDFDQADEGGYDAPSEEDVVEDRLDDEPQDDADQDADDDDEGESPIASVDDWERWDREAAATLPTTAPEPTRRAARSQPVDDDDGGGDNWLRRSDSAPVFRR